VEATVTIVSKPTQQELATKIQEYKDALRLEEKTLRAIEGLSLKGQLAELKMMHHFSVLIAEKAIRDGETIH
jgi:hypothetical protein